MNEMVGDYEIEKCSAAIRRGIERYGAGNSVTIDQRASHGCMTILRCGDEGHRISQVSVPA